MIQHMSMVFKAGGLSVGEGAFLMACANHTDAKGYVIAHMQQVADEAHMSLRSAQETRSKLERRKVIKTAPRFNRKNGAQVANLLRINLDMLKSMERERKDYGATLIEELTFEESEEKPRSVPPADSAPPPADSAPPPADLAGGGGAKSASLLPPSSNPFSLSPASDAPGVTSDTDRDGEREAAAPDKPATPDGADSVVAAYADALGAPLVNGSRKRLRKEAAELLAAGYPLAWLTARAAEMPANNWSDLAKHCEKSVHRVPPQGAHPGGSGRERCPDHPSRYRKGCLDCALVVPD